MKIAMCTHYAGDEYKKKMDIGIQSKIKYCKKHNIDYVEIVAQRDGWIRLLKDRGYKKYYTVLVKDMKDD